MEKLPVDLRNIILLYMEEWSKELLIEIRGLSRGMPLFNVTDKLATFKYSNICYIYRMHAYGKIMYYLRALRLV